MTSLKTIQLLLKVGENYQKQKETFSSKEISTKINEIKYLSAQKKVPRLTLRKSIVHLENEIKKITGLEEALAKQKKHESIKVALLKRQTAKLKKELETAKSEELKKKVNKLSYLLAELLAKRNSEADIKLSQEMLKGIKLKPEIAKLLEKPTDESKNKTEKKVQKKQKTEKSFSKKENITREWNLVRLKYLHKRLDNLKEKLNFQLKQETNDPQKIQQIKERITEFENSLEKYLKNKLVCPIESDVKSSDVPAPEIIAEAIGTTPAQEGEIKHKLLFAPPSEEKSSANIKKERLNLEKELPLPPPPKLMR